MRAIRTEQDLLELSNAAKLLATIAAWQELGLFAALSQGPRRLDELAGARRGLEVGAAILLHARLLVGDGERVGLSDTARRLLEADEIPSGRMLGMLSDLAGLAQVMRSGEPLAATTGGVRLEDPQASRAFLEMLYRGSATSAPQTVSWVAPRLAPGARVLDLGGGHGRYARTFAEQGFQATLMDFPLVIEFARERHGSALEYLAGDFLAGASLGGPWDAVLLSNIVHGQGESENRALIARLHEVLRPGGWLVLKDMFLDETGRDPEEAALFGLTMLLYTARGRSYGLREVAAWCQGSGFEAPQVVVLERYALAMARKVA